MKCLSYSRCTFIEVCGQLSLTFLKRFCVHFDPIIYVVFVVEHEDDGGWRATSDDVGSSGATVE